jgi:hypothetical protein
MQMFRRLRAWLREPVNVQQRDDTDYGAFGRRFGPKVGSARDTPSEDSPAVRRWNQADTSAGDTPPEPRWHVILRAGVFVILIAVGLAGIVWLGSTVPMPHN